MGTGPFAVPVFRWFADTEHLVLALVTKPAPPPRGRSKPPANPMHAAATRHGIAVLTPPDVNARPFHAQLAEFAPELFVVCDYGQILSADTLRLAPLGGINLHGSLLPRYRGAAPVNYAIWNGDRETGVTAIHMTPRLDAGPILAARQTEIGVQEDACALELRLARLGVPCVEEAVQQLAGWDRGGPLGLPQDNAQASRAPRLKKSDGLIDWADSATRICNQVRALKPWPGSFTFLARGDQCTRLILHQVTVEQDLDQASQPGVITRADRRQLWVATGDRLLGLQRVQLPGKRAMDVAELLQGYPIAPGTRLVKG